MFENHINARRHLRERGVRDGSGINILEVGAGTGRFATFVRDAFPRANLIVSDLSLFYLEKARESMAYWERVRGSKNGTNGTCSFVQADA